jgi:hypothetical protein
MGLGIGIGALAGTAGGLAVGLVDVSSQRPGLGNIMVRDTLYGSVLGGLMGMAAGGLATIKTENGEDVALGTSIGALCGAALGIVLGIIEGTQIQDDYYSMNEERNGKALARPWNLNLRVVRDSKGDRAYVPVLTHRF